MPSYTPLPSAIPSAVSNSAYSCAFHQHGFPCRRPPRLWLHALIHYPVAFCGRAPLLCCSWCRGSNSLCWSGWAARMRASASWGVSFSSSTCTGTSQWVCRCAGVCVSVCVVCVLVCAGALCRRRDVCHTCVRKAHHPENSNTHNTHNTHYFCAKAKCVKNDTLKNV